MKKINKCFFTLLFAFLICMPSQGELIRSIDDLSHPSETTKEFLKENDPNAVSEKEPTGELEKTQVETKTESTTATADDKLVKKALDDKVPFKIPMSGNKIVQRFLLAMLCVVGCGGILLLILLIAKKINSKPPILIKDYSKMLETPENIKDAINIFLDKNKM